MRAQNTTSLVTSERSSPYIPTLEEKLHLLEGARKAIDIIALGLAENRHDAHEAGRALLYIVDRMEADLAAIDRALDHYSEENKASGAANIWSAECHQS